MRKVGFFVLILATLFLACSSPGKAIRQGGHGAESNLTGQNPMVQAVLWQQLSGEYKAVAYQTYQWAKLSFDKILEDYGKENDKPLAIITDLDETVLDNGPFFGTLIKTNKEYNSALWSDWVQRKKAKLLPGAHNFFTYVGQKGVEIFYVSNRSVNDSKATMENLKNKGLPFVDVEHVLLRDETSDKEPRRLKIWKTHEILMLLGDNLSDFSSSFDIHVNEKRNQSVDSLHRSFGKRFVIFPNPIYGNWEKDGLFNGHYRWRAAQKDSLRLSELISY